MKKKCSKCGKVKPIEEFYKNKGTKDGHGHYCKDCHGKRSKVTYCTNETYRSNAKLRNIKHKFNLTEEQLNELHLKHSGRCGICNKEFESSRKTFIDHDHATGKVRGLLCPNCNTILGHGFDDVNILKAAISYLEQSHF